MKIAEQGMESNGKYRPYREKFRTNLPDRTWPDTTITRAPAWCSVDLRDGNQALPRPMDVENKLRFFDMLLGVGFRQIEIGYPSAGRTDHEFTRMLIEERRIPAGVLPQVLIAARPDLITKTFQSLKDAPPTIVHVYNATSKLQREMVFRMTKDQIMQMAVEATKQVRALSERYNVPIQYQYSPESFTGTELEFARDVCNAVIAAWEPKAGREIIINLPATVEMATPNVYADQIEWMSRHLHRREHVIVSLHTHNDRGTGIAATELGLLAGAQRVEGTLFGNGERAGNADLVVLALNLFTQGINPNLSFHRLPAIAEVYESCTGMTIPERHPYAGLFSVRAYSGTHQFAISAGLKHRELTGEIEWNVPYLGSDPTDVGREYDPIVVNEQSGSNGAAFVLERYAKFRLPKGLKRDFAPHVQRWCETIKGEILPKQLGILFENIYIKPAAIYSCQQVSKEATTTGITVSLDIIKKGIRHSCVGSGNGAIDAVVHALRQLGEQVNLIEYEEHALGPSSAAKAAAYVKLEKDSIAMWGVGVDSDTEMAAIHALFAALNRQLVTS